jgi:ceramide glucosyltransferase
VDFARRALRVQPLCFQIAATGVLNPCRMTGWELFLSGWSGIAFVWWLLALGLLLRGARPKPTPAGNRVASITVFKPLPPVEGEEERGELARGIESFISQLRPEDEIVLGVNKESVAGWEKHFARWRANWPTARIQVVRQEVPKQHANPKIAWLEVLAKSARGEYWLWSDADVTAPPGFLQEAAALVSSSNHAVTAAYVVRRVHDSRGVLDALFVNVEFLPGAMLLDWLGQRDFGYGAVMLFRAETFQSKVSWQELGAALADDHELGRRLQPVVLCPTLVETFTRPRGWSGAWQHYYRWQKTVRWCQPAGFAALLVVLPGLGWASAVLTSGGANVFLFGLAGQWVIEILVAALACGIVGCRLPPRTWAGVMLWPFARALTWIAVWLPLPAIWSGRERAWFAPRQPVDRCQGPDSERR